MLEWLKRHAWKACNRQNRFAGSNPVLSASFISVQLSPVGGELFFCILYSCCPTPTEGAVDNAKLTARCPHRRLRLPLPSLFDENTTISPFHLFTFSPFHDFGIDENTTISPFHLFTFSPHQFPETMFSPLISPLRQAESHELVIVHSLEETRLLDPTPSPWACS